MFSFANRNGLTPQEFVELLLLEAIKQVNAGVSLTLTARLSSERPPSDSRHLTDTRTRVSTLLEYALAYEMNRVLERDGRGFSVSSVLWNIFPDLIVRDAKMANLVGLEVKALHTAAEEKSANFMTPLKIVRREKDFLVIVSWGWQTGSIRGADVTYPHIHAVGVFDAWLLAKIRDYGWLFNHGGRIKGIDLATPIINGKGKRFKAEEGNLGKLMRIQLPTDMPKLTPHFSEMAIEDARYAKFKQLILALGLRETFRDLCLLVVAREVTTDEVLGYPAECKILGTAQWPDGKRIFLLAGNRPDQWFMGAGKAEAKELSAGLWLSTKLDWRIYARKKGGWKVIGSGAKPDSEYDKIQAVLAKI